MAGWLTESEFVQEETSGGGGGPVGRVRVEMGYKVFVQGMYENSFVVCGDFNDKAQRAAAQDKAQAILNEHGKGDKTPQAAIRITQYKDGVLNWKVENWKGNRYHDYPLWQDDTREIVLPSVEEHLAPADLGKDIWVRLGVKDTLTDRTEDDGKGNKRPVRINYIVERFADEAAAQAAVAGASDPDGASSIATDVLPDWDASGMGMSAAEAVDYIVGQLNEKTGASTPKPVLAKVFAELSAEFGGVVTPEQVAEINEKRIPF